MDELAKKFEKVKVDSSRHASGVRVRKMAAHKPDTVAALPDWFSGVAAALPPPDWDGGAAAASAASNMPTMLFGAGGGTSMPDAAKSRLSCPEVLRDASALMELRLVLKDAANAPCVVPAADVAAMVYEMPVEPGAKVLPLDVRVFVTPRDELGHWFMAVHRSDRSDRSRPVRALRVCVYIGTKLLFDKVTTFQAADPTALPQTRLLDMPVWYPAGDTSSPALLDASAAGAYVVTAQPGQRSALLYNPSQDSESWRTHQVIELHRWLLSGPEATRGGMWHVQMLRATEVAAWFGLVAEAADAAGAQYVAQVADVRGAVPSVTVSLVRCDNDAAPIEVAVTEFPPALTHDSVRACSLVNGCLVVLYAAPTAMRAFVLEVSGDRLHWDFEIKAAAAGLAGASALHVSAAVQRSRTQRLLVIHAVTGGAMTGTPLMLNRFDIVVTSAELPENAWLKYSKPLHDSAAADNVLAVYAHQSTFVVLGHFQTFARPFDHLGFAPLRNFGDAVLTSLCEVRVYDATSGVCTSRVVLDKLTNWPIRGTALRGNLLFIQYSNGHDKEVLCKVTLP